LPEDGAVLFLPAEHHDGGEPCMMRIAAAPVISETNGQLFLSAAEENWKNKRRLMPAE
jgi:hypothetical protein